MRDAGGVCGMSCPRAVQTGETRTLGGRGQRATVGGVGGEHDAGAAAHRRRHNEGVHNVAGVQAVAGQQPCRDAGHPRPVVTAPIRASAVARSTSASCRPSRYTSTSTALGTRTSWPRRSAERRSARTVSARWDPDRARARRHSGSLSPGPPPPTAWASPTRHADAALGGWWPGCCTRPARWPPPRPRRSAPRWRATTEPACRPGWWRSCP